MTKCEDKDLDEIRENHNEWYDKIWAKKPGTNQNWFEETNDKLHKAFKHLTNAARPTVPAKPSPPVGTTVPELAAELTRVTQLLVNYGIGVVKYAETVDALSSDECRQKFKKLLDDLQAETRKMQRVPTPPVANDNPEPLCVQFTKWARSYYDWSLAFREWEIAMADCVKPKHATTSGAQEPPQADSEAQLLLQITPVPWPPWNGYVDEA